MGKEPSTGVLFHSKLGTPEMATRLRGGMPEFDWRLHDSDQYSYYYVAGKRSDGLTIKITPEDEAEEYYLGVYFADMAAFPAREAQVAMAQQVHRDVLPLVEGVRKG